MSYRNDHDAAVTRIGVLEHELAVLRRDKATEQVLPAPKRGRGTWVAAASLMAVGSLVCAGWMTHVQRRNHELAENVAVIERELDMTPSSLLRECAKQVMSTPSTADLNADTTDPNAKARIDPRVRVLAALTPCHALVEGMGAEGPLQAQLIAWRRADRAMDNVSSLITTYYAESPYALDNYTTAPQLWTEWQRARTARDAAVRATWDLLQPGARSEPHLADPIERESDRGST